QSSNFAFPSVEKFAQAFQDELGTHLYTRGNNPTIKILREKLAALEKAEDALVFSSGSAAIAAAIIGNVQQGDHVICVNKPYSWTYKLLNTFLQRFGVSCTFVDATDLAEIQKAHQENTKVLMLESPNSLTYELQDIKACANWAKEKKLVSIIDNSYCSPIFQNPIEMGIDIVAHSGSKYLNGHGDVVFGVLCASATMIKKIFYSEYMTLGAIVSPHDASLILRGLRTLPIRLKQSESTTKSILDFLEQDARVESIHYPLHPSFPQYDLAKEQMRGAGGLFSVNFKTDSMDKMLHFCNALADVFLMAVSWGGYESLMIPTCTFYLAHPDSPPPLPFTFVRFYIGLESADFLIQHLKKALPLLD
ncbi:MAG: PLP-dependent aspartate aminotransferase family protein, partial [Saprospiraceae bacterium]|nr:PLP-dependent aspartate aminotransferase family protein [Saprospiraceae bacterium]